MNAHPFHRIVLKSAAVLIALALPILSSAQPAVHGSTELVPVAAPIKKQHTITITFDNGNWIYTVSPGQPDAKKVKVKRGDTLTWVSNSGSWTVFFKNGTTPLEGGGGNPVFTVGAPSGNINGGEVAVKHNSGATFTYGVRVQLNGSGQTVEDDPEIIIE